MEPLVPMFLNLVPGRIVRIPKIIARKFWPKFEFLIPPPNDFLIEIMQYE